MINAKLTQHSNKSVNKKHRQFIFVVLICLSLTMIGESIYVSLPHFNAGIQHWSAYFNLSWAHEGNLIQVLILFFLMIWLSVSSLIFAGWVIHRSVRKLKGKSWSLKKNEKQRPNFSAVLLYLKSSCLFLVMLFLFVILQYPLQFIVFSD